MSLDITAPDQTDDDGDDDVPDPEPDSDESDDDIKNGKLKSGLYRMNECLEFLYIDLYIYT